MVVMSAPGVGSRPGCRPLTPATNSATRIRQLHSGQFLTAGRPRLVVVNTSARMLRLLSLLQTHRYWPGGELAGRLDVSPRTLRRDIDRLRELGYSVDAVRGVSGGYQLQAGAALPPLLLDDEDAVAIAVALRA